MNTILSVTGKFTLTLVTSILITRLWQCHPPEEHEDMYQTKDRAQFWTAFSNILLVVLPTLLALKLHPTVSWLDEPAPGIITHRDENLAGFPVMLICIGMLQSLFAMVTPKPKVFGQ
jgi:hypothetical protein